MNKHHGLIRVVERRKNMQLLENFKTCNRFSLTTFILRTLLNKSE